MMFTCNVNNLFCILFQDNIPAELLDLLQKSTNPFLAALFEGSETEAEQPGRKKKTVLAKFKVLHKSFDLPYYFVGFFLTNHLLEENQRSHAYQNSNNKFP